MAKENPPFRNLAAVRGAGARARPRTGLPPRAFPGPGRTGPARHPRRRPPPGFSVRGRQKHLSRDITDQYGVC